MEQQTTDVTSNEQSETEFADFVEGAFLDEQSSGDVAEETKEVKTTETNSTEEEAEQQPTEVDYEKRFKDTQRAFNKERELNKLIVKSLEDGEVIDDEKLEEFKSQVDAAASGVMPEDFTAQLNKQLADDLQLIMDATDGEEDDVKEAIRAFGTIGFADPDKLAELKTLEGSRASLYVYREGKKMIEDYRTINEAGSPVEAIRKLKSSQDEAVKKAEKKGYEKAKKELEAQYAEFVPAGRQAPRSSKTTPPQTDANPENWLGDFLQ